MPASNNDFKIINWREKGKSHFNHLLSKYLINLASTKKNVLETEKKTNKKVSEIYLIYDFYDR